MFVEWECKATVGGRPIEWRGIDKFTLAGSKIAEEVVYSDTLPLWAALDPTMERGALVDVASLQLGAESDLTQEREDGSSGEI